MGQTGENYESFQRILLAANGSTPEELLDATQRGKSTLTRSLARLECAGYLVREQDPVDKRRTRISRTAKGDQQLTKPSHALSRIAAFSDVPTNQEYLACPYK